MPRPRGYRGTLDASEMGPPADIPSAAAAQTGGPGRVRGYVLARAEADLVAEGRISSATTYGTPEAARVDRDAVNDKRPGSVVIIEMREID